MMRYLGVDLGTRRIGLALSDPTGLFAKPFGVVDVERASDPVEAVAQAAAANGAEAIVVGLPRHMNGEEGAGAARARAFALALQDRLHIPVTVVDERLTTVAAERVLIEGHMRRSERRRVVDATAAAILLQGHLDARRVRRENGQR